MISKITMQSWPRNSLEWKIQISFYRRTDTLSRFLHTPERRGEDCERFRNLCQVWIPFRKDPVSSAADPIPGSRWSGNSIDVSEGNADLFYTELRLECKSWNDLQFSSIVPCFYGLHDNAIKAMLWNIQNAASYIVRYIMFNRIWHTYDSYDHYKPLWRYSGLLLISNVIHGIFLIISMRPAVL
jgi:hypothetical protein